MITRCKDSKFHCEKLRCEKFRNIMACFEKEEALIYPRNPIFIVSWVISPCLFTHETMFFYFVGNLIQNVMTFFSPPAADAYAHSAPC